MSRDPCGWCLLSLALGMALALVPPAQGSEPTPPDPVPPAWPREFRAAWVATVNNIDWPSRPGLPVADQQREIRTILDLARRTGLNAIIFQVRTAADALYPSPIEPWSAALSGRQGEPPTPEYDPLATWIAEAHARGIVLHAWLNPFRARIAGAKYAESPGHVARTHPELVRSYGTALWLDPGEPEARALTLRVVADLARRYDVDGIHVDDYFYPYPIPDPDHPGAELPFPDDATWARALHAGTTGDRGDWRRANINQVIEAMAATVHAERPRALFGISPFGIARPGLPAGVVGFDQYDKLAADAVLWLRAGWCDYLAPQLYWKVDAPGQPFRPLLDYWASVNPRGRHLWPGLSISRVGDGPKGYEPNEIRRQIAILRAGTASTGAILFSFRALQANKRGITDTLRADVYPDPALIPTTPWLGATPPRPPAAVVADPEPTTGRLRVAITPDPASTPFLWAIQRRVGATWVGSTHPGGERVVAFDPTREPTEAVAVAAVDRLGNTSPAVIWTPAAITP